ncbi:hypothetical protein IAT38_007356 [Cryptococcus sp. DSM 104549]
MSSSHKQSLQSSPSTASPLPGYGQEARWELTSPSSAVTTVQSIPASQTDTAATSTTCRGTATNDVLAWEPTPEQVADELKRTSTRNVTDYWLRRQQLSTHRQPTALTAATANADGSKGPTYVGNLTVHDDFKLGDMLAPLVVECMVGVDSMKDVTELQYEITPGSRMLFSVDDAALTEAHDIGSVHHPASLTIHGKTEEKKCSAKLELLIGNTQVSNGADRDYILNELTNTWGLGDWTTPVTSGYLAALKELPVGETVPSTVSVSKVAPETQNSVKSRLTGLDVNDLDWED